MPHSQTFFNHNVSHDQLSGRHTIGDSVKLHVKIDSEIDGEINSRERTVELEMRNGRTAFRTDGEPTEADAVQIEPGLYSILLKGRSYEVRIESGRGVLVARLAGQAQPLVLRVYDPRRRRHGLASGALASGGPQEISSPMAGRVVKVLVAEHQPVIAGQPLLVVEAMKMQNEIKSPKAGVVARVTAKTGAAINAGEILVVVE